MTLTHKDRVKETSTTTGTGAYTLLGAVTGFQSFSVIGNGNTCYYCATDGTNWEVGVGTYASSGTTLTRNTILASSNAGSAVSWSAGTRTIFCAIPAGKFVGADEVGTDYQAFTASGTWTKPATVTASSRVLVQAWGAGGGGGSNSSSGGGAGGAYVEAWFLASALGATETVTVPAGGAINTAGGQASFGSWLTAYGGGNGISSANSGGGGGGGNTSAGSPASAGTGGAGGGTSYGSITTSASGAGSYGAGGGNNSGIDGGDAVWGGAGGGGSGSNGGNALYGGAGGAGSGGGTIGGTSQRGGNGGASGIAGSAPGGGGGRNAAGGRGEVRVTVFR